MNEIRIEISCDYPRFFVRRSSHHATRGSVNIVNGKAAIAR